MIKQECIGIPDMILLLMIFCFKKIKIKAEIVLSPGGAYFLEKRKRSDFSGIPYSFINVFDMKKALSELKTLFSAL